MDIILVAWFIRYLLDGIILDGPGVCVLGTDVVY